MFIGEYRHTVDEKGRLAVPSRFRAELAEAPVITRWLDSCLAIFPRAEFDRLADRVAALPLGDANARSFRRHVFAHAFEVELDRQGRVLVPPSLREWAALGTEAVIVGGHDHVELWTPDAWTSYSAAMSAPEVLAEHLQGLGF